MRKWIDRAWAKVTAWCLLAVTTAGLILGGVAIAWLVAEGVYLDGGVQLRRSLYARACYEELWAAECYLWQMSGGAIVCQRNMDWAPEDYFAEAEVDQAATALAESFRQSFSDSVCSLTLALTDGTVLMQNYEPDENPLTLSEDVLYDDLAQYPDHPGYRLTAALRSDYQPTSYEQSLTDLAVRWRYGIIALELLCLAGWIFFLSFTLASAGHWRGHEGIHLTWFDRIPADLWLLAFAILLGILDWSAWVPLLIPLYLFLPAFAAQCKAGTVLRGSALWWLLRTVGRGLRWLSRLIAGIPLVWRTALGVATVLLIDVVCIANHHEPEYLILMVFLNLLAGLFLIYLAIGLRTLQKGGRALAAGDYEAQVDTRFLFGDFRRHGEDLNAVQQGIRRAVEQQIKSERLKTELITNVSHDIKTPLTSIVNYVDLLKKEPIDNPAAGEYIAVLDRQSQRLKKLTEDLVEASKAASGAIAVTLSDTDVNVFLSQVVGEYRQRLSAGDIEPVLNADESAPHIRADGKLLWRVLDNLLSNVCKYAMPGTRVYLSSETVGDEVHITVKNVSRYPLNVSADELTERFVRGDASRSTEGSGLGLSIATGLTRLQKGEFHLAVDGDLFKATLTFPRFEG